MHRTSELANEISRRSFLNRTMGLSLGSIALSNLAQEDNCFGSSMTDLTKLQPHHLPKAKRVIFLTQSGGPSQIDLFDAKPGLEKFEGTELPASVRNGQRLTGMTKNQKQLVLSLIHI